LLGKWLIVDILTARSSTQVFEWIEANGEREYGIDTKTIGLIILLDCIRKQAASHSDWQKCFFGWVL